MIDIKSVQAEAAKELAEEQASKAKSKIKASLRAIAAAEQVVANLRREHDVILAEAGADVG